MSCLFPITRIKTEKLSKEKEIDQDFLANKKSPNNFYNDEIFCATGQGDWVLAVERFHLLTL